MRKVDETMDANAKREAEFKKGLYADAMAAIEYRSTLIGLVEWVKREIGVALNAVCSTEGEVGTYLIGDLKIVADREMLALAFRTFYGELPEAMRRSYLRAFFSGV